jgi:hypothetical protein
MPRRAKRLQSTFDEYCFEHGLPHLKLYADEWRQVEYLLWITKTQPFFKSTPTLSKTKDITIHRDFGIYNGLFDHLDKSIYQIQPKLFLGRS